MKRLITIIVLNIFLPYYIFAQFQGILEEPIFGTIKGPVKQVSIINYQVEPPYQVKPPYVDDLINVFSVEFDSIGRAFIYAELFNDKLVAAHFYHYTDDNMCLVREIDVDNDTIIEGTYSKIYFDSQGRKKSSFRYMNYNLVKVDSIVYNKQGKIVEKYISPYMKRDLQLEYKYAYDSQGRLISEKNVIQGKGYTIVYSSNGDYQKKIYEKKKRSYVEKCTVNTEGQLVRKKSKEIEDIYSDYDQYGNWTKRISGVNTHSSLGWIWAVTERIIEYKEQ